MSFSISPPCAVASSGFAATGGKAAVAATGRTVPLCERGVECLEEDPHGGDRLAPQPRRVLVVARLGEERPVCGRPVLADIREPFAEQLERFGHPVIARDGAPGGRFSGCSRTVAEVQEAEDEIVGVLVLVAVLEGEG